MPASQHEPDANGAGVAYEIAWCEFLADRVETRFPLKSGEIFLCVDPGRL
jgi:hypothetical protein